MYLNTTHIIFNYFRNGSLETLKKILETLGIKVRTKTHGIFRTFILLRSTRNNIMNHRPNFMRPVQQSINKHKTPSAMRNNYFFRMLYYKSFPFLLSPNNFRSCVQRSSIIFLSLTIINLSDCLYKKKCI